MSHFFAYLSRMRLIQRWGLMHSIHPENTQEHSWQVSVIAHGLAVIRNHYYEGDCNPERTAVLAMYHDASEVITGDLPTPVKYFNPKISQAYKEIEEAASQRLFEMMPVELRDSFESLLFHRPGDEVHWQLVKAADKIAAYLKCVEEMQAGNTEFANARTALKQSIREINLPEVSHFMQTFVPSFSLTLDELG